MPVVSIKRGRLVRPKSSSILERMGKANMVCTPAPRRGRKKTVRIWEWMVLRTSALDMPTCCRVRNRVWSS